MGRKEKKEWGLTSMLHQNFSVSQSVMFFEKQVSTTEQAIRLVCQNFHYFPKTEQCFQTEISASAYSLPVPPEKEQIDNSIKSPDRTQFCYLHVYCQPQQGSTSSLGLAETNTRKHKNKASPLHTHGSLAFWTLGKSGEEKDVFHLCNLPTQSS